MQNYNQQNGFHMLFRKIWIIGVLIFAASCSISPKNQLRTCTNGHTVLDGTCVTQEVANYVSCVRAQGAELGTERAKRRGHRFFNALEKKTRLILYDIEWEEFSSW